MSGQSNDVARLFEMRMQVIGRLSQENAEHLRIVQLRSGQDVLSMKSPDAAEINAAQQDAEAQLEACEQRIGKLELELAEIDKEIATAAQKEN